MKSLDGYLLRSCKVVSYKNLIITLETSTTLVYLFTITRMPHFTSNHPMR